jgi:hypothetical protein
MKKIPVSFSDYEVKRVKDLANLMGISDVYGDFPKTLKFSIKLAYSAVINPEKVYKELDSNEMSFYFTAIKKAELLARIAENSKKEAESIEKV